MKKYIVTNFSYGTGPYLRTTELAIAFNDELEKKGKNRLGIIVPLVYGDKQKKIMLEEFSAYTNEIFLDEELGKILSTVFYGDNIYEEAFVKWIDSAKECSRKANRHLLEKVKIVDLFGKYLEIDGKDIVVEINRSPRIRYDVAPSYFSTFGYIAEILNGLKKLKEDKKNIKDSLIDRGIELANWVESSHRIHAIAYPGTHSYNDSYKPRYNTEILTPPISRLYKIDELGTESGIFITTTGIPGLNRLFEDARRLDLMLFSNDTATIKGSIYSLPHIIPNKNIILQFARSGWSSVWLSMISGTPLVVPEFDIKDDPEIYFNNIAVEHLGIGTIYRGQPLEEILERSNEIKKNCSIVCDKIINRWGTLDGNSYCAKIFVDDFLTYNII